MKLNKIYNFFYYLFIRPKIFFPKKSYSLLGEDVAIKKLLKNKKKGYYVDVGAYHPLEGSNTHLLFKDGWSGVNIDVSPLSIELFKMLRPNDSNINKANSKKKSPLNLYFKKKINMLNTLSKFQAKKNFPNGYSQKKIITSTLNSIIQNSKFKNKKIDFLNIDIEGGELEAIKSLNFKLFKPKFICIELHNYTKKKKNSYLKNNQIYKFLTNKNYKICWNNQYSYIFKI